MTLDLDRSKLVNDVIVKPHWVVPDSVLEWAEAMRQAMIEVETQMFDGVLTGAVGAPSVAPYWSK